MTAIGLFVAVPAVMGYNWLLRRNRAISEQMRLFAADVHSYLVGGARFDTATPCRPNRRDSRDAYREDRLIDRASAHSDCVPDLRLIHMSVTMLTYARRMKRYQAALLALLIASSDRSSLADPLHKYGNDGRVVSRR